MVSVGKECIDSVHCTLCKKTVSGAGDVMGQSKKLI